jgi:hypothetical protein
MEREEVTVEELKMCFLPLYGIIMCKFIVIHLAVLVTHLVQEISLSYQQLWAETVIFLALFSLLTLLVIAVTGLKGAIIYLWTVLAVFFSLTFVILFIQALFDEINIFFVLLHIVLIILGLLIIILSCKRLSILEAQRRKEKQRRRAKTQKIFS